MTTVKELKAYLETLDENLEVSVMREYYQGWSYTTESVDLVLPDKDGYSPNMDIYDTWIFLGQHN